MKEDRTELDTEKNAGVKKRRVLSGLSGKLLMLTIAFILLAEILIFFPSIANFRNVWLRTHLDTAEAASIVYNDISNVMLSEEASKTLLDTALASTIAIRREGRSQLIATSGAPSEIIEHIDLDSASAFSSIRSAISMLFAEPNAMYRVFGQARSGGAEIEIVQSITHIQAALWGFARNILLLSLLISVFAAALVYLALYRLIVRPIIQISGNMQAFSQEPENAALIYQPSNRTDEIGVAEERLSAFQDDLQNTLRQKQRLADLGLAVSKINHDLRNILASAQLFSDRLTTLPDPTVQRFAPKLIRTIDRAIDYTKAVLDYGRALETPPKRRRLVLHALAEDVNELLGVEGNPDIKWVNTIDPELEITADPEQLFRALMNVSRNAYQAMLDAGTEAHSNSLTLAASVIDNRVRILISDTGPGIPEHIQPKLFRAFQASTKSDGTGLGLSIAAELIKAHGGTISLESTGTNGTVFVISLPAQSPETPSQSDV